MAHAFLTVLKSTSRGAYVTKDAIEISGACAHRNTVRVRAAVDPQVAAALTDYDDATLARMEDGNVFEAAVAEELRGVWTAAGHTVVDHGGRGARAIGNDIARRVANGERVLFVNDEDADQVDLTDGGSLAKSATMAAMKAGAAAIWGAVLPYTDTWSGKPDMLVAADPTNPAAGYLGVDVKHHKPLTGSSKPTGWLVADLAAPFATEASDVARTGTPHTVDALQLAHYHRRLTELGYDGGTLGGVIGRGRDGALTDIVFFDLATTSFPLEVDGKRTKMSALDLYDTARHNYLTLVRHEVRRLARPDGTAPLTRPRYQASCDGCPMFTNICKPQMRDAGEATFYMPGVTPARMYPHEANGRTTVADIAALHRPTAAVVAAKLDAPSLKAAAQQWPIRDAPAEVLISRPSTIAGLHEAGIRTVGDLADMDDATAAYSDTPAHLTGLPDQIDQARAIRAAGGEGRVFRARGVDVIDVGAGLAVSSDGRVVPARADVEIHIDMENDLDDQFWIGMQVRRFTPTDDADRPVVRDTYHAYTAFDHPDEADVGRRSAKVLADAWRKICNLQRYHSGKVVRVYYYTAAEKRVFRHHAATAALHDDIDAPSVADVDAAFAGDVWVDLAPLAMKQLIWPTRNHTLKSLAKYTRFTWRDEDPSGANCVLWYRDAVAAKAAGDTATFDELYRRIEAYNEDDCAATARLVEWMWDLQARTPHKLPSIATLDTSPVFTLAI